MAAVVVPALLVLYFLKLRRREMAVSSTLLWKKAIQDLQVNAPFQRLRRNLLLLLQMLLLLLLVLSLARPVVNFTPGAGKLSVILIDRSASMSATDMDGGKSRLEEAKRRAKALVDTLDRDATAAVVAFDSTAETVQPMTADTRALKTAIDSIQPTDRKSRLKLAYQLADAQTNFNPEQLRANVRPDVWLYSDARVLDSAELTLRGNLHYDRIGTDSAGNIAVVALSAKRNYERPTEVEVFARLANYGPEPVTADVVLSVDDHVAQTAEVSLPPERWNDAAWVKEEKNSSKKDENYATRDSVQFTVELQDAAVIKVEQKHKDGDTLAADDVAQVVVPPPKTLSVLLVTDGNYFLEKALNSLALKKPDTIIPTAYEEKVAEAAPQYDVIIFDRYSPKKLPVVGSFVYFGSIANSLKLKAATDEEGRKILLKDTGILEWDREHPILRHLNLNKIFVGEALKLDVPVEDEVLITGIKGPLAVIHREGRSTHLVVGFDLLQSNWPLKVSFPIFLHNSLQYLAVGSEMDVRESYEPGSTPKIGRANLLRVDANLKEITLNGPMGSKRLKIPEAGDFVLPPLDKVGVYTLSPQIPQYEQLAVNLLDGNESNLMPENNPPGNVGETIAGAGGKTRLELWWWLVACAALPVLMIEWWVYTRRVHL